VFRKIPGKLALMAGLAAVVGLLVAGCGGGGSTASQQEIAQAERHGRVERAEKEKERQLEQKLKKLERENQQAKKRHREKELRELKEKAHGSTATPPSTESAPAPAASSGTDCGGGTIAGPETSCGFALETRAEYENDIGAGSGEIEAWSQANETWYPMYCTESSRHECSGAISATVYWP
jgi:hypothetical protein